ncbi:mersacidin/lichenicidin family type 2 lantibiotic [Lentzea sp. NPDC005914]|uniref:mersacidin/lichenicidin family type 2 lantibiotic n=1 Tax=Lentzea sp. NPDC005914 TaxID=3154572 RepID=UPI0033EE1465
MSGDDIVRYWKDEEYRLGLGAAGSLLPANPAGMLELTDEALESLVAGAGLELLDSCGFLSCNNKPKPPADPVES